MIEIGMNGIVKNYGYKNVLNGVDLEIQTGERVALVGRNGSGKTTIFKIIAGEEAPNAGSFSLRKGSSVGYLEQIPALENTQASTRQVLQQPFAEAMRVEAEMRRLEEAMASEADPDALQVLLDAYQEAQNAFAALDGYAMEEEFARVTTGFGLEPLLERPFNVLSGGQKTIVKLAATILRQPSILLLDEPTNHLDIATLEWFESFISKYRGTVLIISHDRYFLDRVANKTVILEAGTCQSYNGNYSYSLQEQERQMLLEFEQYKNQQKKIEAMQAAIKRLREWGTQGDNPKFFRKANELERRLEKMELLDKPQLEAQKIPIHFSGQRSGREVLVLRDFNLRIAGLSLLEGASLTLLEKQRLCLMGGNGTGKTTLVRAVLDQHSDFTGELVMNPSAKIGYIPQEIRFEDDKESVLAAFRSAHPCPEHIARSILGRFTFYGEHVMKRVGGLSGGEKVLLKLAMLIQNQVNFLMLDEPTNHIDIELRQMLEEALQDYKGTLLFISHDRYFINAIATHVAVLENHGFSLYDGNYDAYRAESEKLTQR